MKQEKILHQNKDTWKPSTKEYKHDPKQGHLETESFIMRQSVFRHQHVEICNSIHQPLETVIPISMGRTLTLWPHGGRPVSLAESLLQLLSLGLSFPPIVFSISAFFTLHENFLLGAVEPPILKKTHEKKKHNKPIPNNKQILTIPALLALSVYHLQIQPVPSCAGITPIQSYPLEKWPSPWPTAAFQVFRASSLRLPGSGMFQGCNIINCIYNYINNYEYNTTFERYERHTAHNP